MTYGALELTGKTLTIVAIVALMLLLAASFAHAARFVVLGLSLQFLAIASLTVLVATWFTQLGDAGWTAYGPFPVVGVVILGAAALIGPPWMGRAIDKLT